MDSTARDKLTQEKGKAREALGKVTGNRKQQLKGKAEQFKGKASETVKDVKNRYR